MLAMIAVQYIYIYIHLIKIKTGAAIFCNLNVQGFRLFYLKKKKKTAHNAALFCKQVFVIILSQS